MQESGWITKAEAAAVLEVHEKTIERLVKRGKIRQGWRPQTGGRRSIAIFCPDDIAALKTAQASGDILPDTPPVKATEKAQAVAIVRHGEVSLNASQASQGAVKPLVEVCDRVFLSLDEAVAYSGLPKGFLEGLIVAGKLKVYTVGRHGSGFKRRIKRADLEALEL